jgi:hypothetical protein
MRGQCGFGEETLLRANQTRCGNVAAHSDLSVIS